MTDFSSSPFGNSITSTDVLTLLTAQAGWQNKYRQLIQLGNKIPALSDDYKIAENQIKPVLRSRRLMSMITLRN
jgi:cysteine desulfuration protein SufE